MSVLLPAGAPFVGGALGLGAIGALISGRREFLTRWLSFLAATPVLLLASVTGRIGAAVFAAAIGVVCSCEYARMVGMPARDRAVLVLAVLGAIALGAAHHGIPAGFVLLASVTVPVLAARVPDGLSSATSLAWGIGWLGVPLAALPDLGGRLLPVAAAVSIGDVAAYFGGSLGARLARRHPVAGLRLNALSPNKTWAGALVGAAAALGVVAALGAFTLSIALAVTLGGVGGDLVESMVKRGSGVKDAGAWLPGFGGLCDRVDSLLGALFVLAAFR